jgi:hypothetical protein
MEISAYQYSLISQVYDIHLLDYDDEQRIKFLRQIISNPLTSFVVSYSKLDLSVQSILYLAQQVGMFIPYPYRRSQTAGPYFLRNLRYYENHLLYPKKNFNIYEAKDLNWELSRCSDFDIIAKLELDPIQIRYENRAEFIELMQAKIVKVGWWKLEVYNLEDYRMESRIIIYTDGKDTRLYTVAELIGMLEHNCSLHPLSLMVLRSQILQLMQYNNTDIQEHHSPVHHILKLMDNMTPMGVSSELYNTKIKI